MLLSPPLGTTPQLSPLPPLLPPPPPERPPFPGNEDSGLSESNDAGRRSWDRASGVQLLGRKRGTGNARGDVEVDERLEASRTEDARE